MQIVIEIPDYMYEVIKRDGSGAPKAIDDAIANGTPLPKWHGDLIDRDELKGDTEYDEEGVPYAYSMGQVWNASVVIPADKEDAEC